MKAQVREIAVLASAVLLCACTSTSATPPSSVATSTTTSTSTTTTTTVAATTTTSTVATTTTVLEVDGVPAELLALIGAPMPEVDLTIESEDDVERWLEEFGRWNHWIYANPTLMESTLLVGAFPESPYFSMTTTGIENLLKENLAVVGGSVEFSDLEVEVWDSDMGILQVRFEVRRSERMYFVNVSMGTVEDVLEPEARPTPVTAVIRRTDVNGWTVEAWIVG